MKTEDFYVSMGKLIKHRDHARGMVARWKAQVAEAEAEIESLTSGQAVLDPTAPYEELSDGTDH